MLFRSEPQAVAGFSSGFGSAAPQAEPQAVAGFSSGFGSAAPQAEPQGVAANAATFFKLLIIVTSLLACMAFDKYPGQLLTCFLVAQVKFVEYYTCLLDFLTSLVYT